MSEWTPELHNEIQFFAKKDDAFYMPSDKALALLTEIERLQKDNTALRELVVELMKYVQHDYENGHRCQLDEGSVENGNIINLPCSCGVDVLLTRAKEMIE